MLFPSDTVYGLACSPTEPDAIERIYALKGRDRGKPVATMWFSLDGIPPLPPRTDAAARALLPGPVTLVVGELGLRVPEVPQLARVRIPVVQTSANHSGGADARRLADVPEDILTGVDLVVDGGELPGTPSTVVDLTAYEHDGTWKILRAGALPEADVAAVLDRR